MQRILNFITLFVMLTTLCFSAPLPNVRTSWLGNSFGKGLTPDRQNGKWVQNLFSYACVSPHGRVYTTSGWDEGGRNAGIYGGMVVNGKEVGNVFGTLACCEPVNETGMVGKEYGPNGVAVAVNSYAAYAVRNGVIHKYKIDGSGGVPIININAYAMYATETRLAVLESNLSNVKIFSLPENKQLASFTVQQAGPLAIAPNGDIWIITGIAHGTQYARENAFWVPRAGSTPTIKHYSESGAEKSGDISYNGTWFPSCIAFDATGRLMVGDAGPRRQVLFYDISTQTPALVATLGQQGGISAGVPGVNAPDKFWTFRGIGSDKENNIYVVCDEDGSVIRKFDKEFNFIWELHSCGFVQSGDFMPGTDGRIVMTPNETYTLDYTITTAGGEARFSGYTLDWWKYPKDPRLTTWSTSAICSYIQGKRILMVRGMFGAGSHIFRMAHELAVPCDFIDPGSWAMLPDSAGNLWYSKNNKVVFRQFNGFTAEGCPQWLPPIEVCDKPAVLSSIERLEYDMSEDALYMTGNIPQGDWGIVGTKMLRISGFMKRQNRTPDWVVDLPYGPGIPGKNRIKAITFVKEAIFAVGVETRCKVLVYQTKDGQYVGDLVPGPEVNGVEATGWVDVPYGIRAIKRSNGEYAVLVEEDGYAKILLLRWCPTGNCPNTQLEIPNFHDSEGVSTNRTKLFFSSKETTSGFYARMFDIQGRLVYSGYSKVNVVYNAKGNSVIIIKGKNRLHRLVSSY